MELTEKSMEIPFSMVFAYFHRMENPWKMYGKYMEIQISIHFPYHGKCMDFQNHGKSMEIELQYH